MRTPLIAAALAMSLAACGEPSAVSETAPPPAASTITVAKADPAIRAVRTEGDVLVVEAVISDAVRDLDLLLYSGRVIRGVAGALQAGAADAGTAGQVRLSVAGPDGHLMTLFLDAGVLRDAELDDLPDDRALNLVTGASLGRLARVVVATHCASERGQRQNVAFCKAALAS